MYHSWPSPGHSEALHQQPHTSRRRPEALGHSEPSCPHVPAVEGGRGVLVMLLRQLCLSRPPPTPSQLQ